MRKFVLPYSSYSESARALAQAMDIPLLRTNGRSSYRYRDGDVIICWGNTRNHLTQEMTRAIVLNHPVNVRRATNKLDTFEHLSGDGISTPPWTTNADVVREWLEDGRRVVVRTVLDGSEGEGIQILEGAQAAIPRAPLYTMYIPKDSEWRVHVGRGNALAVRRKVLRNGVEEPNRMIRNTANGYVFQRNINIPIPDPMQTQAVAAVRSLGLDFGAVDVIWNRRRNNAFVLEVNTAPGIEGTTVQDYARFFNSI